MMKRLNDERMNGDDDNDWRGTEAEGKVESLPFTWLP